MVKPNPEAILHGKMAGHSDEKDRIVALADTAEAREEKVKLAAAYRLLARRGLLR